METRRPGLHPGTYLTVLASGEADAAQMDRQRDEVINNRDYELLL